MKLADAMVVTEGLEFVCDNRLETNAFFLCADVDAAIALQMSSDPNVKKIELGG